MKSKRFCPFCGAPLTDRFVEGRPRRFCARCDEPIYENPVPATCVVVTDGGNRVLLVKRAVAPRKGEWCLPGGFMEMDETPDASALRELKEETGLDGRILLLLGISTAPNRLYGTVLMAGYLVTQTHGELTPGDDVSEAVFFEQERIPDVAFDSHRRFIRLFYAAHSA